MTAALIQEKEQRKTEAFDLLISLKEMGAANVSISLTDDGLLSNVSVSFFHTQPKQLFNDIPAELPLPEDPEQREEELNKREEDKQQLNDELDFHSS